MDNLIISDTEKRQAVLDALSSNSTHYMVICEKTGLGTIEVKRFLNALIDERLVFQFDDEYGLIDAPQKTELEILEEQIRKDFYQRGKALKEIREGGSFTKASTKSSGIILMSGGDGRHPTHQDSSKPPKSLTI